MAAKSMALRQGLPYGSVMATAGAAAVASACGLHLVSLSLLGLAIVQAAWIVLFGVWRYRGDFRLGWPAWLALGPSHEHSGIHTVPLGMAVVASGLIDLGFDDETLWLHSATATWLCLAWILTLLCVGRFIASLALRAPALTAVDGSWFLVPAVLLGIGKATAAFAVSPVEPGVSLLALLALVAILLGWAGYWLVAAVACLRIRRFGLGNMPQAPWWIGMGCAGLAAAALAGSLKNPLLHGLLQTILIAAMAVTAFIAVALFIPVAVGGLIFLLRTCRFRAMAPWPPTFSTAVCALGCMQAGEILHSITFGALGLAASAATLLLWLLTTGWNSLPSTYRTAFGRRLHLH